MGEWRAVPKIKGSEHPGGAIRNTTGKTINQVSLVNVKVFVTGLYVSGFFYCVSDFQAEGLLLGTFDDVQVTVFR